MSVRVLPAVLLHGHHSVLVSWWCEYEARKAEILRTKDVSEHAERLRHMQPLTPGALADLPTVYVRAVQAYDDARQAYAEACNAYPEVWGANVCADESWYAIPKWRRDAYNNALWTLVGAGNVYAEARRSSKEALEAWHQRHCLALRSSAGCRWNGVRLEGIGESTGFDLGISSGRI